MVSKKEASVMDDMVRRVSVPAVGDLDEKSRDMLVGAVIFKRMVDNVDRAVEVSKIKYRDEVGLFLERYTSPGTRSQYYKSLLTLVEYAGIIKMRLFEFTPVQADGYVFWLAGKRYRRRVLIVSFWRGGIFGLLFLSGGIRLGGSKVMPKVKPVRDTVVPDDGEVELMPGVVSSAVKLFSCLGLRVGALDTLAMDVEDGVVRYRCYSKGKWQAGVVPQDVVTFLHIRGIYTWSLFRGMKSDNINARVRWWAGRLYREGRIKAHYSCHDFRHYFAIREYCKDRDIWRVSRLLGHNSLGSTQFYLKGLKVLA